MLSTSMWTGKSRPPGSSQLASLMPRLGTSTSTKMSKKLFPQPNPLHVPPQRQSSPLEHGSPSSLPPTHVSVRPWIAPSDRRSWRDRLHAHRCRRRAAGTRLRQARWRARVERTRPVGALRIALLHAGPDEAVATARDLARRQAAVGRVGVAVVARLARVEDAVA